MVDIHLNLEVPEALGFSFDVFFALKQENIRRVPRGKNQNIGRSDCQLKFPQLYRPLFKTNFAMIAWLLL